MIFTCLQNVLCVLRGGGQEHQGCQWGGQCSVQAMRAWYTKGTTPGLKPGRGVQGLRGKTLIPCVGKGGEAGTARQEWWPENPWRPAFRVYLNRPFCWPAVRWAGSSLMFTTIDWRGPGEPNFCGSLNPNINEGHPWWSPGPLSALTCYSFHVIPRGKWMGLPFLLPVYYIPVTKKPLKRRIQMCRIMYEKTVYIFILFEKLHID